MGAHLRALLDHDDHHLFDRKDLALFQSLFHSLIVGTQEIHQVQSRGQVARTGTDEQNVDFHLFAFDFHLSSLPEAVSCSESFCNRPGPKGIRGAFVVKIDSTRSISRLSSKILHCPSSKRRRERPCET